MRITLRILFFLNIVSFSAFSKASSELSNSCEALNMFNFSESSVISARYISSDSVVDEIDIDGTNSKIENSFCRVSAILKPTKMSNIKVEVWLPDPTNWNKKLLGIGNSGVGGAIGYNVLAANVENGFVTVGSDLGTSTGIDNTITVDVSEDKKEKQYIKLISFDVAIGKPEMQKDWAYRSIHLMTVLAKKIAYKYYGTQVEYSYFEGCSTGGQQGLTEAVKYPDDYDGIIVGAPGNNRTNVHLGVLWGYQSIFVNPESHMLSTKKSMVRSAVLDACDGIDGMIDGLLNDPRQCKFDPGSLLCANGDNVNCLTESELASLRKIYSGPTNPITGKRYYPGLPPGAEESLSGPLSPHIESIVKATAGYLAWAPNSSWDGNPLTFDFHVHAEEAVSALSKFDTLESDLYKFKNSGGKMIIWSGTLDGIVQPDDPIEYYNSITNSMGGAEETKQFLRLYMAPGMYHCGQGPGPNVFDMLSELDNWVDKGIAPKRIRATKYRNDNPLDEVIRSMPLCPYPQSAVYKGSGSVSEGENFICQ